MQYRIKRLASFDSSAFEADLRLYAYSEKAADKSFEDYTNKIGLIEANPYLYQVFEDDPYFRSAPLVHGYRLFYHVDEQGKSVILHRIFHGSMDLISHLMGE